MRRRPKKQNSDKKLEKTLREEMVEHERLHLLINSMTDAVIATDPKGRVVIYNGAALELLNTNESLRGQLISEHLKTYTKDKKPVNLLVEARKRRAPTKRDDILYEVEKGDYINLYASISPIYTSYGNRGQDGFIFFLRDITKEKSIEAQRDEFISVTSHELRTPIAVAEAAISTAMLPAILNDPKKAAEILRQAHDNIMFLSSLVTDLTTLAKAERGLLDIDITTIDPENIIEQLQANSQSAAKEKGLKLKAAASSNAQAINSSEYHILEILQNLVTNSIKYTREGSVTIGVEASQTYDKGLKFTVADTGIGISVHDRKKVFDKFFRSEDYRTRETGGTGLGLYVSKRLAERLGGTLSLDSTLNKGSSFYLDIPDLSKRKTDKKQPDSKAAA